jgi:sugar-specific transcriptional regulator TrmB
MNEQLLTQIGLTADQAKVYRSLIGSGPVPARKIIQNTGLKRGLAYKVIDQLIDLGLVEKEEGAGKVTVFSPAHPERLKKLFREKEEAFQTIAASLVEDINRLASQYNLVAGKPGVQFYEGVGGMKEIYNDILATGQDFYLIRSNYEPTYKEEMLPTVENFIKKRVKKGIHVVALTPKDEKYAEASKLEEKDKEILFDRTWIDQKSYQAPVEIDIYANKVAMLSFGQELIGTIIESPQIANAMRDLFLHIRNHARRESPGSAPQPSAE